jgi:hypothetical protein
MALLHMDGFDQYGTDAVTLPASYWTSWSAPSSQLITGRSGTGKALRRLSALTVHQYSLPSTYATLIMGAAFRFSSGAATAMFAMNDSNANQLVVAKDSNNKLVLYRGTPTGSLLATSTNSFSLDTWYHVEIKATIHNTAGAYEVRVNGSSVGWIPAATNVNTRGTANNHANQVALNATSNLVNLNDIDDFYVLDTSGSRLNDFLGDSKIETKFPDGAGTTTQWTPTAGQNFECVDNNPPNDSVFVSSETSGHRDLYNFGNLADGSVLAAVLLQRASKSDAGTRSIQPACRSGGTVFLGAAQALGTSFVWYPKVYDVDPNTSAAWTLSTLNSAEFGQDVV